MDGLLVVLIMLWVFIRLGKKKKKGQTNQSAAARRRREAFQQMINDAPQATSAPVQGSMNYESMEGRASTEGEDTCDPALGHERISPAEPDSVYAEEIGGGLPPITPQSLVQGVVMSEILKRPTYRW